MSKYVAVISYDTGGTFNPRHPAENIEYEYDDIEQAREAAKAIREHHDTYCEKEDVTRHVSEKNYRKTMKKYEGFSEMSVEIPVHGEVTAYWNGYFETLRGIEVVERFFKEKY